jgi:transcription antitermination factor NusA-like protein
MKAIVLISSIFYILGLKIGNKIDIVKKSNPVEKIITNCITPSKPAKAIHFDFEQKDVEKAEPDTLKSTNGHEELVLKEK